MQPVARLARARRSSTHRPWLRIENRATDTICHAGIDAITYTGTDTTSAIDPSPGRFMPPSGLDRKSRSLLGMNMREYLVQVHK